VVVGASSIALAAARKWGTLTKVARQIPPAKFFADASCAKVAKSGVAPKNSEQTCKARHSGFSDPHVTPWISHQGPWRRARSQPRMVHKHVWQTPFGPASFLHFLASSPGHLAAWLPPGPWLHLNEQEQNFPTFAIAGRSGLVAATAAVAACPRATAAVAACPRATSASAGGGGAGALGLAGLAAGRRIFRGGSGSSASLDCPAGL
jgi:hypothetical protein